MKRNAERVAAVIGPRHLADRVGVDWLITGYKALPHDHVEVGARDGNAVREPDGRQ
ncbi:hypothetical protein D3C78_986820 [compost metagenome]